MISFTEFVQATAGASGRRPYPWQVAFAEAAAAGQPPAVVATPTGTGKTMIVDALIWALAMQSERPSAERTVGVRTIWAIDRRILVDEVHEHAAWLAKVLETAAADEGSPLFEIANRLARLGGGVPLVATRWRGGLGARPAIQAPMQPQIITSTVAQVGSRLLFRGYGLGTKSLALSAGLTACDTTICLDEAHLARPLRKTIAAIRGFRAQTEDGLDLPGLHAVTITATPDPGDVEPLRLTDADLEAKALQPRLHGKKVATLVTPVGSGESERIAKLVEKVGEYIEEKKNTIACVVNTVGGAREVHSKLRAAHGEKADIVLLVGPQRPADRAGLLDRHRETLFKGVTPDRPFVCVATQTFEVGLDADVEAMVTESASASALIQRFGRLNRSGKREGHATVVRDLDRWLYRDDEPLAWVWLEQRADENQEIDISVATLMDADPPAPVRHPVTPTLTSEVVDLLVQTSPRPAPWAEPDVEAFLAGVEAEPDADVRVCWRCDLRPELESAAADEYRRQLLAMVPPQRAELLNLSVRAARALLAARFPGAASVRAASKLALGEGDVEGEVDAPSSRVPDPGSVEGVPFVVLREGEVVRGVLRGGLDDDAIHPYALRPGDVVVLPTRAGGCDEFGLAPQAARATDVADDLQPAEDGIDGAGRRGPVRITREALSLLAGRRLSEKRWSWVAKSCDRAERQLLATSEKAVADGILRLLILSLRRQLERWGIAHEGLAALLAEGDAGLAGPVVLRATTDTVAGLFFEDSELDDDDALDDVDDELAFDADEDEYPADVILRRAFVFVSLKDEDREDRDRVGAGGPPSLHDHLVAVGERAQTYAKQAGLAIEVKQALGVAGRAHDLGKAYPRMQAYFHRGVASPGAELVAKSVFGTRDLGTHRTAQALSGLPRGLRHELASVAALRSALENGGVETDGYDADLALYLVGTHHGRARPFPPVPRGGAPASPFVVSAGGITGRAVGDGRDGWEDGEWAARFWRINERYGPWGTAYLEALLVSADRSISGEGS